jgi:hypothetical protein
MMIYPHRLKAGEPLRQRAAVTPVPKFLFSEQKLKILPQGGACAMFSTEDNNPPLLQVHLKTG